MPVYEYECGACGHQFEEWQKISDAPITVCPKCSEPKVQRLISATAFHLKGGGWYKDLYSSSKGGTGGGTKSEGSAAGKSDSGKSDSGKSDSGTSSATPAASSTGSSTTTGGSTK